MFCASSHIGILQRIIVGQTSDRWRIWTHKICAWSEFSLIYHAQGICQGFMYTQLHSQSSGCGTIAQINWLGINFELGNVDDSHLVFWSFDSALESFFPWETAPEHACYYQQILKQPWNSTIIPFSCRPEGRAALPN